MQVLPGKVRHVMMCIPSVSLNRQDTEYFTVIKYTPLLNFARNTFLQQTLSPDDLQQHYGKRSCS